MHYIVGNQMYHLYVGAQCGPRQPPATAWHISGVTRRNRIDFCMLHLIKTWKMFAWLGDTDSCRESGVRFAKRQNCECERSTHCIL